MKLNDKISWQSDDDTNSSTSGSWNVLPVGEYLVKISKTEVKPSKKGDAIYVDIKFEVVSPTSYKNRLFFFKYFMYHETRERMVKYSLDKLKQLSFAALGKQVEHASELEESQLYVTLEIERGSLKEDGGKYSDTNKIVAVRPLKNITPQGIPSMGNFSMTPAMQDEMEERLPF